MLMIEIHSHNSVSSGDPPRGGEVLQMLLIVERLPLNILLADKFSQQWLQQQVELPSSTVMEWNGGFENFIEWQLIFIGLWKSKNKS